MRPFNGKASAFMKGRQGLFEKLKAYRNSEAREVLWFHAASLGEFEQGLPVMEQFKLHYPQYAIVVSFFSPSGYERRKDHPIADFTCYLPLDTSRNAAKFIQLLKPKMGFLIKYEFWYHHIKAACQEQIPIYSLSSRFTPKHIFFKKNASFQRNILDLISHFFVQTPESKRLLNSINNNEVTISGDTRFDRVKQIVSKPKAFEAIAKFKDERSLLIVGSAWDTDMKVLAGFINNHLDVKVIIAPHEVDDKHIKLVTQYLTRPFDRFTKSDTYQNDILVLDTIGMLSHIYQYGDFAYIGGAMGPGLHNILEAVAFGLPVVFGNKGLEKFPESTELSQREGAFIVGNEMEAHKVLTNLLDQREREKASKICLDYVEEKAGATEAIMSYFKTRGL